MTELSIEKEIQDKGLDAPRLTPALIDSVIKDKVFHVFGGTCLTVCCLTLTNGFTVTGESACASPENFNAEIGEKIAFEQASNKIWMLEGYLLKQKLYEAFQGVDTSTFVGRLYVEHAELKKKIQNLQFFITSKSFGKLPEVERDSLTEQLVCMNKYLYVLSCRVSRTSNNA